MRILASAVVISSSYLIASCAGAAQPARVASPVPSPVELTETVAPMAREVTAPTATTSASGSLWGDIDVSAHDLIREGEHLVAEVCLDAPGGLPWMIRGATLEPEGKPAIGPDDVRMVSPQPSTTKPGQICEQIAFLAPESAPSGTYTLSVLSIDVDWREGEMCKPYEGAVREALRQKDIAIAFECHEDHAAIITLLSWPDTLGEEQAKAMIEGALFMRGPWQFELHLSG
jgi:hypothetical protein